MTLYARVISHDPNNIFQQPGFLLNPIFFCKNHPNPPYGKTRARRVSRQDKGRQEEKEEKYTG
jgi:hypothetical protein